MVRLCHNGRKSNVPTPNRRLANLIGPIKGLEKMFSSHVRRCRNVVSRAQVHILPTWGTYRICDRDAQKQYYMSKRGAGSPRVAKLLAQPSKNQVVSPWVIDLMSCAFCTRVDPQKCYSRTQPGKNVV